MQNLSFDELCPYIRCAGNQRHYNIRARKMYDHEMLYCFRGTTEITIEDRKYQGKAGTLFLIKPNTLHSIHFDEKHSGEIYWIHFDFIFRKDVCELQNLPFSSSFSIDGCPLPENHLTREEITLDNWFQFPERINVENAVYMEDAFKTIVSVFNCQKPYWQLEVRSVFLNILKSLIYQVSKESVKNNFKNMLQYSEIIENYIKSNYFRKITVSELSKIVGVGSSYVGKIFKKETGTSLLSYINNCRLVHAKKLLEETDIDIEDIADMVCFNDISYFCNCMKKKFGHSPSDLRKLFLNSL